MKDQFNKPITRRQAIQIGGALSRIAANPLAGYGATSGTALKTLERDAFDVFWNQTPHYSTALNWMMSLTEFRHEYFQRQGIDKVATLLENYNNREIGAARDVAYQVLHWRHYRHVNGDGLYRAIKAFQSDAPSLELLREILSHPVFEQSDEYQLFVGNRTVEEAAKRLHDTAQWSPERVRNFIESYLRAGDSYMQPLEDLTSRPDIQKEMRLLSARGYPSDPHFRWMRMKDYPVFGTAYRHGASPIPHDYYAKPKADSWVGHVEGAPTRIDANIR